MKPRRFASSSDVSPDDHASPGEVGFGPAPGSGQENEAAGHADDPYTLTAPKQQTRWAARPAGQTDVSAPERLWLGLALFVALVTGAALVVRRLRQSRR